LIDGIISDRTNGVGYRGISSKFHNTIAEFFVQTAEKARMKTSINKIALSGGVFCNRFLSERLIEGLQNKGFTVLFNRFLPANDGCVSLGQAAIAAAKV
jgi:hydrogenase maturation protein HypF